MHATKTIHRRFGCRFCFAVFNKRWNLGQHLNAMHSRCRLCKAMFGTSSDLQIHQRKSGHLFCHQCDLHFSKIDFHLRHVREFSHATQHYCCDCSREYIDQTTLNNHCCDCDQAFQNWKQLKRHFLINSVHTPRVRVPRVLSDAFNVHECKKCGEIFQGRKELNAHNLAKRRHISCPAGEKCKRKFATPSALFKHLESGSCHSGMTYEKINQLVFAHDEGGYITSRVASGAATPLKQELPIRLTNGILRNDHTNCASSLSCPVLPSNLNCAGQCNARLDVTWSPLIKDEELLGQWPLACGLPPTSCTSEGTSDWSLLSDIHTPVKSPASDISVKSHLSGNPTLSPLHCPLCLPNGKGFITVRALQAHMFSAAHAPKIFHCPLAFVPDDSPINPRKKMKHFSTLSGLTQHLESGACRGGCATFRNAIKYVEEQLRILGFGEVKLLSN